MRKLYILRSLTLAIAMTFSSLMAMADTCLVVEMKSGATHSFVLSEKPQLTFEGAKLSIVAESAETRFSIADVNNFHFEEAIDAISMATKDSSIFKYINGVVTVAGVEGAVTITDASGRTVCKQNGTTVTIDMNAQPAGIYVVNMGNRSVKIRR